MFLHADSMYIIVCGIEKYANVGVRQNQKWLNHERRVIEKKFSFLCHPKMNASLTPQC